MANLSDLVRQIETELARGEHGPAQSRFMPVRQLATRYGVSLVTAHRVVQQLKQRGLLVADSTNPPWVSPQAVRPSAGSEPKRLGMVITNIASPFFSRLCRHAQQAAAALGYQMLVAGTQYDFQRERRAIESFIEIGVDGLLIVPGVDDACPGYYRELIDRGARLALVSRQVEQVPADFVIADSFAGSAAVAGHLLSMGYDSFGYIGFGPRLKRDARQSGFRSALVEAGVTLEAGLVAQGEGGGIEHGYRAMGRLMRAKPRPRAVFAFHDLLAIGALRYCHEHGIDVPGDVALAGFDDLPESQVTSPPLTTVSYPIESMARLAVQCLTETDSARRNRPSHRILLEPHLVVRRSSDPAAPLTAPAGQSTHEGYETL